MIIAICGEAGSGKTSVGRELAKRLGYRFYSASDIARGIAKKRGLTLEEFTRLGEKDESLDREIDSYQERLGKEEYDFVIVGRMSGYFIPKAFKVFLDAELRERARRVLQDRSNREGESYSSLEDAQESITRRRESDRKRYKKYYGFDPFDKSGYDLVIDTTDIGINEVVERIVKTVKGSS